MGTLNVNTTDNQINITPTDTQIRVFAGGYAQPGGNDTEIQYNDGGVLAGAANITYTNGNMVISNNNFKITGGTNGYFLQTDGTGNLTWYPGTAFPTGNGTVGGANGQIQFNNAGNFGGLAGFTANVINNNISMPNNLSVGSNINVARITATGNITANYFIGNGAFLTGIDASKIQNGNSNVSVLANGNIIFGVSGNANVVTVTGNNIVANGNVTANFFIGNIDASNIVGVVANANYAANAGISNISNIANSVTGANVNGQVANALVSGTVYTNAQPNITSIGALTSLNIIGTTTIQQAKEKIVVNAVPANTIVNFDLLNSAILLQTANAQTNFTLNIRGNSTTALNDIISNNESMTCTFINQNGANGYYANLIQIDSSNVTVNWVFTGAPDSGLINGKDVYTFNIMKLNSNVYTIFGSKIGYK